jgi:hypothetical protein
MPSLPAEAARLCFETNTASSPYVDEMHKHASSPRKIFAFTLSEIVEKSGIAEIRSFRG